MTELQTTGSLQLRDQQVSLLEVSLLLCQHCYLSGNNNVDMQVALAAGKRTAWIDKGPYYEVVQVSVSLTIYMFDGPYTSAAHVHQSVLCASAVSAFTAHTVRITSVCKRLLSH